MGDGIALVAGAGGALGRATVASLAAAGFTVVAIDRNEQALRELPDDIRREVGDPTDPEVARSLVDRIAADVGVPEVLVNTIGAFRLGDTLSATPDDLRVMLDANLGAAWWLSQAAGAHMVRRGSGAIVHVAARPALEPAAGMAAYSVSKAALAQLTRILDMELRPQGVRVNAIAPQVLDTAQNRATFSPNLLEHAVAPEAIADLITFLASNAAAPVSGAVIPAYGA